MERQRNAVILNLVQELENIRSRLVSESIIQAAEIEQFSARLKFSMTILPAKAN